MINSMGVLHGFRTSHADLLHELIKTHKIFDDITTDAIMHALVDISESIEKIYGVIIPGIINTQSLKTDDLKDKLWDIREEFRHIQYHISDAKLTEL